MISISHQSEASVLARSLCGESVEGEAAQPVQRPAGTASGASSSGRISPARRRTARDSAGAADGPERRRRTRRLSLAGRLRDVRVLRFFGSLYGQKGEPDGGGRQNLLASYAISLCVATVAASPQRSIRRGRALSLSLPPYRVRAQRSRRNRRVECEQPEGEAASRRGVRRRLNGAKSVSLCLTDVAPPAACQLCVSASRCSRRARRRRSMWRIGVPLADEPRHIQETGQAGRRRILRGTLFAGIGALALAATVQLERFLDTAPNGRDALHFAVAARDVPRPGDPPRLFKVGRFYLVNLRPGEGGFEGRAGSPHGGIVALDAKCPHRGCTLPWRGDFVFLGRQGWFRCSCHGSTFTRAGLRVFGPAPRAMD